MRVLGNRGFGSAAASARCRSPAAGRGTATFRRRRAGPSRSCGRRREKAGMSARDAILGKIRRSLGVAGGDIAPARRSSSRGSRARRESVIPARGQLPPGGADRAVRRDGGEGVGDRRPRRRRRRRAGGDRRLPPRPQSAGDAPDRRRSAASPRCHGTGTQIEVTRGASDGDDPVGAQPCHRRRRRDRHAGADLRRRQSDDAQFPAGNPHRRRQRRGHRRRLRDGVGRASAPATARAACRARST